MAKKKAEKTHRLGTFSGEVRKKVDQIKKQVRGEINQRRGSIEKP